MKLTEIIKYLPETFQAQIDTFKLESQADDKVILVCPLHDDTNPSAVLFYKTATFHCSACGDSWKLDKLVKEFKGLDSSVNLSALKPYNDTYQQELDDWKKLNDEFCRTRFFNTDMFALGYTLKACRELLIAQQDNEMFSIPVILDGVIQDIRSYYPNQTPKYKSRFGATTGLIIPYDIWKQTPIEEPTYICAGEKDMFIARSKGLNAICITGGELAEPKLIKCFQGRECYIFYDNDETGHRGGRKLANFLVKCQAKVKNVTKFHDIVGDKGDIYDFFVTYEKTVADLKKIISDTLYHKSANEPLVASPQLSLLEIHKDHDNRFTNKHFKTNVQCIETDTKQYSIPTQAVLKPIIANSDLPELHWDYTLQKNPEKILKLFNNIDKYKDVEIALMKTLKVSDKKYRVEIETEKNFYCGHLRPYLERGEDSGYVSSLPGFDYISHEYLESSRFYEINYIAIKNDSENRATMLAIYHSQSLNDYEFEINDTNKQLLANFQNDYTDPRQKVTELYNRACDNEFLTPKSSRAIWEFFELVFCSPLEYFYQDQRHRAAIHACAIGDSQIGKSWTLERMIKYYGRGRKLNAKMATTGALTGGSNKSGSDGYRIRAGELVFNHKGLVGIEEIHGHKDYFTTVTEVKSSGMVQITRVSGSATFACLLRLIEIANPKKHNEISVYDTGYDLIKELITQPEDIGRVDLFGIFSNQHFREDKMNHDALKMFLPKAYQTRINWIWSRKPEQIIMNFDEQLLQASCHEINEKFLLDVPIFGGVLTTNRILRLACAYAGMLVSTDSTFQNLIVKDEHIKLAKAYFLKTYADENYKLDMASRQYRLENEFNVDDIEKFNDLDKNEKFILRQIAQSGAINASYIKDILGFDSVSSFYRRTQKNHWILKNNSTLTSVIKPTKRLVLLIRKVPEPEGGDLD